MKVLAVVSLVGLIALIGCGEGGSSEAQSGGEGVRQSSLSNTSAGTSTVRHAPQHSSQKQKAEPNKPATQKDHASPSAPSSGVSPVTAEEFEQFAGTDKGNWEIAYGVCAVTPESQLAKEFHTEQNWAAIGHAYGQGYSEPFNIAAEEGCMAALIDSSAERDAAFKMMEG